MPLVTTADGVFVCASRPPSNLPLFLQYQLQGQGTMLIFYFSPLSNSSRLRRKPHRQHPSLPVVSEWTLPAPFISFSEISRAAMFLLFFPVRPPNSTGSSVVARCSLYCLVAPVHNSLPSPVCSANVFSVFAPPPQLWE